MSTFPTLPVATQAQRELAKRHILLQPFPEWLCLLEVSCSLWPPHVAEKAGRAFRAVASVHLFHKPFLSALESPDPLSP